MRQDERVRDVTAVTLSRAHALAGVPAVVAVATGNGLVTVLAILVALGTAYGVWTCVKRRMGLVDSKDFRQIVYGIMVFLGLLSLGVALDERRWYSWMMFGVIVGGYAVGELVLTLASVQAERLRTVGATLCFAALMLGYVIFGLAVHDLYQGGLVGTVLAVIVPIIYAVPTWQLVIGWARASF